MNGKTRTNCKECDYFQAKCDPAEDSYLLHCWDFKLSYFKPKEGEPEVEKEVLTNGKQESNEAE